MKMLARVRLGVLVSLGIGLSMLGAETNASVATPLINDGRLLTLTQPGALRSTNNAGTTLADKDGRMMSLEATKCSGLRFTMEITLTPEEARRMKARREIREKLKALRDPAPSR